jgi:hypothetical protein
VQVPGPVPTTPVASREQLWPEVLRLAAASRRLRALLDGLTLEKFEDGSAELSAPPALTALARSSIKELEELLTRAAGRGVTATVREHGAPAGGDAPQVKVAPAGDIRQHPLVKAAEELFGARVVRVESKPR